MATPGKLAEALAIAMGNESPFKAENDRLAAEIVQLKADADGVDALTTQWATLESGYTTQITDLTAQLATSADSLAAAESRATAAELRATEAEKTRDETEKSVNARANQLAADQMAALGQPAGKLPSSEGKPAEDASKEKPVAKGPRSEADAVKLGASHWKQN